MIRHPAGRAGRAGLERDVCVALGNWLSHAPEALREAVAVRRDALEDPEALVRDHAA